MTTRRPDARPGGEIPGTAEPQAGGARAAPHFAFETRRADDSNDGACATAPAAAVREGSDAISPALSPPQGQGRGFSVRRRQQFYGACLGGCSERDGNRR